jgi:outer membrane lipoprotein-sorting protein
MILSSVAAEEINAEYFEEILAQNDFRSAFLDVDFSATMTMISEDPEDGISKRVIKTFRRDGEDKFLMLFQEPESKKGQGHLRIDDNMWMYDPQSRKFTHISLKESFDGTDAKNSDFKRSSLSEDFDVLSWEEGKLGKFDVWIIDLEASNDEVAYPYMKVWIDKKTSLRLKSEDYSLNKRLMRTSLFPNYTKVGNSYAPTRMIFTDKLIENKKTQITMTGISIEDLPDSVFTKAYVERVSR